MSHPFNMNLILATCFDLIIRSLSGVYKVETWSRDYVHIKRVRHTAPPFVFNLIILRGLSPQANNTDRATAACRRS
jgi:hypothetical protein